MELEEPEGEALTDGSREEEEGEGAGEARGVKDEKQQDKMGGTAAEVEKKEASHF